MIIIQEITEGITPFDQLHDAFIIGKLDKTKVQILYLQGLITKVEYFHWMGTVDDELDDGMPTVD
jgi:hypothetical protein